jgi:uncharacterized membrane protein
MFEYINLFLVSSFLGWILEYIYNNKKINRCGDVKIIKLCMPLYFTYGFASIFLLIIKKYFSYLSDITIFVIGITIIALLECLVGQISNKIYNGKKTWNYTSDKKHLFVFCNGYVSFSSVLFFGIIGFIYYKYLIKKCF